jgi:Leucine-rich repeat (LRR) protein
MNKGDDDNNNEGGDGQDENQRAEEEEEKRDEEDEETQKQREQLTKFKEDLKAGLSSLSKTADNLTYAYTKLTLAEKGLELLYEPILELKHLRYLDLSSNQLIDIGIVTNLRYLLSLNVSKNMITSL